MHTRAQTQELGQSSVFEEKTRFGYLDGLRGVASVAVFFWHHFLAFFPAAIGSSDVFRSKALEIWLYRSPLAIFFAGDLAVYIFFVLSGFVISIKHFRSKDIDAVRKSFLRRYVRLMPPALVTIMAAYLILSLGLNFNKEAAALSGGWWLSIHWSETAVTFLNAFRMGIYGMWFEPISAGAQFNSNLGTLALELIGSFVVFATIIFVRLIDAPFEKRLLIYAALIIVTFLMNIGDPHYISFFAGMVLADVYASRPSFFKVRTWISATALVAGIYLGAVNVGSLGLPHYAPLYGAFTVIGLHPLSYPWMLSSVLLLYGVLANSWMQRILSSKACHILGVYSFPLFLIHTILLCSFTSFAFVSLSHLGFNFRWAMTLAFLSSLPVLLCALRGLQVIDEMSTRLSRKF